MPLGRLSHLAMVRDTQRMTSACSTGASYQIRNTAMTLSCQLKNCEEIHQLLQVHSGEQEAELCHVTAGKTWKTFSADTAESKCPMGNILSLDNSLSVPGEIIPVWTTVQVSQGNFILEETAQFKSPRGNLFLQRQHTPSGTVPGGIPVQASPGKDFLLGQASSQRETKHHSPQSVH